jgi:protein-tyrosine-phosphatase
MAEAAANSLFALKGLEASYRAQSRGICAAEGACASPGCVYACGLHGLDVSQHVSRQFGAQDADDAALILTMAKEHKAKLCALFPKNRQKIYTLSEFVAIIEKKDEIYVKDIGDPFGMPFSVYELFSCRSTI